jgi:uncharacterized protein (UPF0332 family)/predicted nucleotidyltransferase
MEINELLNNLREHLLKSSVRDKIIKILVFGSHSKKTATANSDIDILILTSDGKHIEKSLMDNIYEFMMDYKAPLEVIVSNIDNLYILPDFFSYSIIKNGMEVYSMEEKEIKKIMIKDLINLSEEYLESAKEVLTKNRVRLSLDAAYNSAELAAKALILLKEDDLPGSHGGIVSLFGQLFIKTNEINIETGRKLNTALKLRNEARYKPHALLTVENAQEVLTLAENLIKIVSEKNI